MKNAPHRRLGCWRARRRRNREPARSAGSGTIGRQTAPAQAGPLQPAAVRPAPARPASMGPAPTAPAQPAPGETVAATMQLAIGLLTASVDSPELEAWAAGALTPQDADGLGNFMAGLHVVAELLLRELHTATGESAEAILQRLAMVAEHLRESPSAG